MSETLTPMQVQDVCRLIISGEIEGNIDGLCDSHEALRAENETLRWERDDLMRSLFPSGVPTDYPWHQTIRMVLDGMNLSHQQHLTEAAERVRDAEAEVARVEGHLEKCAYRSAALEFEVGRLTALLADDKGILASIHGKVDGIVASLVNEVSQRLTPVWEELDQRLLAARKDDTR